MKMNGKRIVVKVGSSTLTHPSGMLNLRKIEGLCAVLADLQNAGYGMILVSSGAVSAGWTKMGLTHRPQTTEEKQAAAAVGQCELMSLYDRHLLSYGHTVAQILLTRDALENPVRRSHAENTFRLLCQMRCIPIVNENDSVSSDELCFGGNDILSAYVAELAEADLLINLSDVDGFYDSDPRKNPSARLISHVAKVTEEIERMASGAGTERGTGGMQAKLTAAKMAMAVGIPMVIAGGADPAVLYRIIDGENIGTRFGTL